MGDWVLSFLLILLEALAIFFLALSFAPSKRPKQVWRVVFVSALIICLEANFLNLNGTVGTIIHVFFLLMIYASMVYYLIKCRVVTALALTMLSYLFLGAIDCVFLSASFSFFSMEEQMTHHSISYAYSFLSKLSGLGAGLLFYQWRSRHLPLREPDMAGWILILLFSIPAYLVTQYLARKLWFDPDTVRVSLSLSLLLTFVCIGVFFLMDYSGRRQEADRENTALRQNLKLETAHIAAMEGRYTQQRKQTHDFKNQLAVLRDMARRNVPQEEFAAYLDSVVDMDMPGILYVNTHRTVMDIIISEKVPAARDKGIDFQFQLDDLTAFPMSDDALVVVLTNLIDNAVEACEKIPQAADRHILLKMKMEPQTALLGIENTTAEPVVVRDNMVQTTKDDPMAHGYGLKNVAAMIERSGGMWFIEYRDADKRFSFSASLPREKK